MVVSSVVIYARVAYDTTATNLKANSGNIKSVYFKGNESKSWHLEECFERASKSQLRRHRYMPSITRSSDSQNEERLSTTFSSSITRICCPKPQILAYGIHHCESTQQC
jgi:hypothetical protein